jgi:cytoskeletal protein CcmA (bactofilin family)
MWNPNRTQVPALDSERFLPDPQITQPSVRLALVSATQSTIGKGLIFSGDITGTESIYIEGKVEGTINLPGNCVTVGHSGQVNAGISAGEIVVRGRVRGDVSAFTRVEIHADGALTGDVTATRISIEDGAFFKGGIDIRKPERKADRKADRKFPPESESEIELLPESQKSLLL